MIAPALRMVQVTEKPHAEETNRLSPYSVLALVKSKDAAAAIREGEPTLMDYYGATNEAEFFAVATECFFECGPRMREQHPELYAILRGFYRQDTAVWTQQAGDPQAKRA